MIIALNKIDKIPVQDRKASKARVLAQLIEQELVPEEYGGDALVVEIAGKSGEGIELLVETIALQADVLELKAVHEGYAEATVLTHSLTQSLTQSLNHLLTHLLTYSLTYSLTHSRYWRQRMIRGKESSRTCWCLGDD